MTSSTGFRAQSDALESHFGIKLDPSLAVPVRSANVNRSNANWPLPLVTSETVCASTKIIKRNHMKLITLIGITGISLVTLALAQETTSPAPEEKPSTTIQETPAPAPETTTATTPSEQTAAQNKDTYKSAVNERLAVRSYGPGVAVVIGTAHEKGTTKDGKPFDRTFRYTDTWVQRGGQWLCVASQVMKIKG